MRPRVFVSSWFFAPYVGSADTDLFKRLKYCDLDFDVVQVRRRNPDPALAAAPTVARFERTEVDVGDAGPRTVAARAAFVTRVLQRFEERRGGYAVMLSHSNEVPSHAAALAVRQRAPDLPWVAYFGDVVSRNPYVRYMAEYPLYEEDCYVEQQTLRTADVVVCNNEHQRALFAELLPAGAQEKLVVVPHPFDPALYPAGAAARNPRHTFVHLGTLYSVKRRAAPVLKAVDLLLEVYPALAGSFEVLFVGDEVDDEDLRVWQEMAQRDCVRFLPSVSYVNSLGLMRHADTLVLIDGMFDEHADGLAASPFFPCKLADYLGAQRPILAVTMARGPTADVLRALKQPLADDSPERIAFVMKRHLEGRVPPVAAPQALDARQVGAQMEAILRRAAGEVAPVTRSRKAAPRRRARAS